MLVSAEEMLTKAKAGKYAVGQFNINNLEWTKAILLTAQELNSPVILGVSEGAGKYMCGYKTVVGMVNGMLEELNITVPVALHLDHGSYEGAKACIEAGFSSIMFDGSHYPIEENVEKTEVVKNVKVKEKIGYVADSNQMFSNYKVQQLVKMYENIFEKFSREDFQALNRIFQVPLHHRISHLSKGQQMRTAFMLNLARNPEVMVLDEPTSGLDAMAKKELLDLLVTTVENREMTVLISSHHLSELEKICDNVTVIKNGRVYIDDELESVKNQIIKYQVVFTQGAPKELYERTDLLHLSNVGSVYTVVVPAEKEDFEQQMKQIGAVVVEEMPVGLEESFVYMNKAQKGVKVNAQV